jgi:hypothetical protein
MGYLVTLLARNEEDLKKAAANLPKPKIKSIIISQQMEMI